MCSTSIGSADSQQTFEVGNSVSFGHTGRGWDWAVQQPAQSGKEQCQVRTRFRLPNFQTQVLEAPDYHYKQNNAPYQYKFWHLSNFRLPPVSCPPHWRSQPTSPSLARPSHMCAHHTPFRLVPQILAGTTMCPYKLWPLCSQNKAL